MRRFSDDRANPSDRCTRVVFAVGLIIGLGLMDLVLTRWQMATMGMFESNPIARWVVRSAGTADALIPMKLGLLAVGASVLLAFRRRRLVELGTWLTAAAHLYMAMVWVLYLGIMAGVPAVPGNDAIFIRM